MRKLTPAGKARCWLMARLIGWLLLGPAILPLAAQAQGTPTFDYAVDAGSPLDEDCPKSVLDPAGNTFIVGYFHSVIHVGSFTLTAVGRPELYVAKLDPAGHCLWARQTTGVGEKFAFALAADQLGNAYLAGIASTGGTSRFGSFTLTSPADTACAYVAKISGGGQWRWVQAAGRVYTRADALAVDANGTAYLAGIYHGATCQFGSLTLANPAPAQPTIGYVACLDSAGTWQWARNVGASARLSALVLDDQQHLFATGSLSDTVRLGTLPPLIGAGQSDVLAAQLDALTGTWLWARRAGGTEEDYGSAIAYSHGRLYVSGSFASSSAHFGSFVRSPTGGLSDVFVARLTATGAFEWATTGGGPADDDAPVLAADAAGNAYVGGQFRGATAHFGSFQLPTRGEPDIFVTKLDSTGQYRWAVGAGSYHSDRLQGLSLAGPEDDLVLSGWFEGGLGHFGPHVLAAADSDRWNGFVARLSAGTLLLRSVSPASGAPGQTVTLTGSRLTGVQQVLFGGVAVPSFSVLSATSLRAIVPVGAQTSSVSVSTATTSSGPGPTFQIQVLSSLTAQSHLAAVWPVPVTAPAPLSIATEFPATSFTLRTALGAVVRTGIIPQKSAQLATAGLPAGIYFLTLHNAASSTTQRIVME